VECVSSDEFLSADFYGKNSTTVLRKSHITAEVFRYNFFKKDRIYQGFFENICQKLSHDFPGDQEA
jgi:hypothetical protein